MIYLDYAADTPVDEEVLQTFCEVSRAFAANPNARHEAGQQAGGRLREATGRIAAFMHVKENEIIYTSGATESNNLAITGAARQYKKYGRHIITTWLEHSSVNGAMGALQNEGFEVDYVDVTPQGVVDLAQLRELLREDTILVSVCMVDSEIGLCQPVGEIAALVKEKPRCLFHVDATQAVGKLPVSCEGIDLLTFAPHKFNGLNGCGVLIKKEPVQLEPLIRGGISVTPYRSGTPALALIASTEKALSLCAANREQRLRHAQALNARLREVLQGYKAVHINSTAGAVPFILNISMRGVRTELFQQALSERGICVSTKSACCAPNTPSRPVYALTKDRKAALSTLRISVGHQTRAEDIEAFLQAFDACYRKFVQ